jgi:pimeloyl-ACP methyl ester carboxylesterase
MTIAPDEQFADVGDLRLCYETFGHPSSPTILLIMGLGTQMLGWHADLCGQLAGRGFHVVRFDNRDVGRSTRLDGHPPPTPLELVTRRIRRPAYTLEDMADDAAGLLDALGVDRAHVVGASMGGMIAQTLAGRHPERVLSLTSIMSTTGSRWKGQPALRVYPTFLAKPPRTKEAYVDRMLKLFRLVGSPGFDRDERELVETASLAWDRGPSPAGLARQLAAIIASGDRTPAVSRITAPTLVVHGTKDKLVRVSGGKATARAIRGARLMLVDGMGHDLPRGVWPRLVDAIAGHAAGAEARSGEAAAA